MPFPLHQYASVPLAAGPRQVRQRLVADPQVLVCSATAAALTAMGPHLRRWGLRVSELPTTTASTADVDELGSVEVAWRGSDGATGWPALAGRLVVVPAGAAGTRVMFFSSRSPRDGFTASRAHAVHRQRIVRVGIQRFLHELRRLIDERGSRPPTTDVVRFVRTPMFLHHLQLLGGEPGAVYDHLVADLQRIAERATHTAVAGARSALQADRFRALASPAVRSRVARAGEPASVWVGWRGDEESTGWPQLDFSLLIETGGEASRLALLSSRAPGYDLSSPRIDKQQRDLILRSAGPLLAEGIAGEVGFTAAFDRVPAQPAGPVPANR